VQNKGGDDPANAAGPKDLVSCGAGWAYAQNTPFRRYKGWVHEGGIATPLVAYCPGVIPAGRLTRQVVHVVDLLPTCAEIAGATYPEERAGQRLLRLEGRSLLPVLRGDESSLAQPDELCWKAFDNRAVRQGRWKLVRDQNVGRWELYDVEADRTETRDVAEQFPDRVQQLAAIWHAWADRTGQVNSQCHLYASKRRGVSARIKIALIGDSTVACTESTG
jgi:arylsulfatase